MRLFLIPCLCSLLLASLVLAQPQRANRTPPNSEGELEGSAAARYQLALGYLRGLQFERGISVLEELYESHPDSRIVFDKLKESYVNIKEYENAIALLDNLIAKSEHNQKLPLTAERAQLLYLNGNQPAAMDAWYAVVESAPDAENAYRIVYGSMIKVRLLVQAIDLLLQGRKAVGSPSLFQTEIAYLYSLTGQHELAVEEYLNLLTHNRRQLNYVKGRLARELQQEGALEAALQVTKKRVAAHPELWQLRELLAWLYEESGEFELAYQEVTILEAKSDSSGQTLHQFAVRSAQASAFAVAAKAFEAVLHTHPDENIAIEAQLGIADMYRLQSEQNQHAPKKALEAYRQFLIDFPQHPQIPLIMTRIATLYQDVLRDRKAARSVLEQLVQRYAHTPTGNQAQFDLGRLAVAEGDLEQAKSIFAQLSIRTSGELSTHSRFEEARIYFYSGQFLEAQSILKDIMESTDREVANDAIALHVLLLESSQQDSTNQALQDYAHASLFMRQYKSQETIRLTQDILAKWGQHPIVDDARFLRAEALLMEGRTEDAQTAFGEFSLLHPDSPLRDRSLFNYAELLETKKPAEALEAYTDLLTRYPGSLLVSKTRERIRSLRAANL